MSSFITNSGTIVDLDARFLLCVEKENNRLYVLHREFPRCLIFIEPTTPINFVVLDFFENKDEEPKAIEILTSESFKKDLKDFVASEYFNNKKN